MLLPMIALLVLIHFDAFDLDSLMVISFAVSAGQRAAKQTS